MADTPDHPDSRPPAPPPGADSALRAARQAVAGAAPEAAPEPARSLADLPDGEEASVVELLCDGPVRRRLLDLGLIPGTRVRRRLAACGGDPVAYEVRGSVVALRLSTARQILVGEPSPPAAGGEP